MTQKRRPGAHDSRTIKVELKDLPAPKERVFANGCAVLDLGLTQELLFTLSRSREKPRAVASLMASTDAITNQLLPISEEFSATVRQVLQTAGLAPQTPLSAAPDSADVPVRYCNVFRLARLGSEALVEAYWVSPQQVAAATGSHRKIQPEPVIQIQLPLPVLVGILEHLSSRSSDLKRALGNAVPTFGHAR